MLDTTVKAYTTQQLGRLALAVALALPLGIYSFAIEARAPAGLPGRDVAPSPVQNDGRQIRGSAHVIDGDTLIVGDVRIRLEGIDAPEADQYCTNRIGVEWRCGLRATLLLARLVEGQTVTCEDRGPDKYGRTLGSCRAGGLDLNAEMVRRGFAWAFVRYSKSYVALEAEARAAGAGIWSGTALPAWEHRASRWHAAEPAAPAGCAIKGNVTAGGRIYHMPWSPWYNRINMDASKGKRWFCNEAEALAAGWRPAQVH